MNDGSLLPLLAAAEGVAAEEVRVVEGASGFLVGLVPLTSVEFLEGSPESELEEGLFDTPNDFWEHRPLLLFLRRRTYTLPDSGSVERMGISSIGAATA